MLGIVVYTGISCDEDWECIANDWNISTVEKRVIWAWEGIKIDLNFKKHLLTYKMKRSWLNHLKGNF